MSRATDKAKDGMIEQLRLAIECVERNEMHGVVVYLSYLEADEQGHDYRVLASATNMSPDAQKIVVKEIRRALRDGAHHGR